MGKSRSSRSSTSPRTRGTPPRAGPPGGDGEDVPLLHQGLPPGSPITVPRRSRSTKTRRSGDHALELPDPATGRGGPGAQRAGLPLAVGRLHAGRLLLLAGELHLQVAGLLAQVDSHEARRQAGEVPDERGGADEVGDRVGHRDPVGHAHPLGLREGQAHDGLAGGADDGGLGEGPGEEAGRGAGVVAHEARHHHRGGEAGDRHEQGERQLRQRVAPQAPEELGADLVAGAEEEEVEEDHLHGGVDHDPELPHRHAGEQAPEHVAEREGPETQLPELEADGQRQEDGQLRVLAEDLGQAGNHGHGDMLGPGGPSRIVPSGPCPGAHPFRSVARSMTKR